LRRRAVVPILKREEDTMLQMTIPMLEHEAKRAQSMDEILARAGATAGLDDEDMLMAIEAEPERFGELAREAWTGLASILIMRHGLRPVAVEARGGWQTPSGCSAHARAS
jgi:hypothetical protein